MAENLQLKTRDEFDNDMTKLFEKVSKMREIQELPKITNQITQNFACYVSSIKKLVKFNPERFQTFGDVRSD